MLKFAEFIFFKTRINKAIDEIVNTTNKTCDATEKYCDSDNDRIPNARELDKFICEIIFEITGGDRFLCNHVIKTLNHTSIDNFEEFLYKLSDEHSVETNIKNRISDISLEAQKMLLTLSHTQFIEVDNDDIPAEELKMLSIVLPEKATTVSQNQVFPEVKVGNFLHDNTSVF